ncbi:MAG: signal peptidase I [Campylobacterales bacterium]|nr:signal peptidase I [Campylobacterales bacterium]
MKKLFSSFYKFSSTWTGTVIIVLFLIFFVAQSFVIPSGSMKRTLLIGDFLFAKKYSYGVPIPHLPWLEVPLLPDFNKNGHLITGDGPKRGEVVIFRNPQTPKVHFVKRCVAVGEDELIYVDRELYLRPHEGDEYIKQNYKPEQIVTINEKLWVKDPYKDIYPGINYTPEMEYPVFELLLQMSERMDMRPVLVEGIDAPVYNLNDTEVNALYRKVPKDNYYMIGDNRENSNDSRFWGPVPYSLIVGKPWLIYFSIEHRSYESILNEENGKDHAALKRVCGNIDINSPECAAMWEKERFKIRWNRIGQFIESIEKEIPTE